MPGTWPGIRARCLLGQAWAGSSSIPATVGNRGPTRVMVAPDRA